MAHPGAGFVGFSAAVLLAVPTHLAAASHVTGGSTLADRYDPYYDDVVSRVDSYDAWVRVPLESDR